MADDHRKYLAPRLADIIDRAGSLEGLHLKDLDTDDIVEIFTRQHRYVFRIIDPASGLVRAHGDGEHLRRAQRVYLQGSSLTGTGSTVKTGWIGIGYRLLIGRDLLLSATRSIAVNGVILWPRQDQTIQ